MDYQHRRSSSMPLITPFHDFSLRVDALLESDLAANLRRWTDGHEIQRALRQLYDAVRRIEASNGLNGPLLSWNAPSRPSGLHRWRHSRPDSPYTPPRTPTSNIASDNAIHTGCRARMDDLRHRLDRDNAEIERLSNELASAKAELSNARTLHQDLRTTLASRNSNIADLRETVARQHQRLSRQRDSLHSSRSATPVSEHRQSKASQRKDRHCPSPSPEERPTARNSSAHTPSQLDLDAANLRSLIKRGKHDEAEKRARALLRKAEVEAHNPSAKRTVAWMLALICEHQHKYTEAQRLLMGLPPRAVGHAQQEPTNEAVLALLAHVELKLRDFGAAEDHARTLWEKNGLKKDEKWQGFHPVDTLIRALALQGDGVDGGTHRFCKAHTVWREVYENVLHTAEKGRGAARVVWQEKVGRHAETGLVLAKQWKESCERRGKVPRTAEMVRVEAEEVRRLAL